MSLEARITDAQRALKESGPSLERISVKVAIEALPERGLVIIRVKISLGIPTSSSTGDSHFAKSSDAPEEENMETPTINAHIVGKSLRLAFAPSETPPKNAEK